MKKDPIEKTAAFRKVSKEVDTEVDKILEAQGILGMMGSCHIAWAEKKRILKEKHGIDWRSPGEMNPDIMFD